MPSARRLVVSVVFMAACDPPREPQADAEPPAEARVAAQPTAPGTKAPPVDPPTQPAAAIVPKPLEVTLTSLTQRGDQIEIEVALDTRLPPTATSRPTLQLGELTVRRSRRAQGQLDRLVFFLSADELSRVADGTPLVVRDRGYSSEQMQSPPVLDKSKLAVTP